MAYLFANNAKSTLSAPISSVATTLSLSPGTGDLFPDPAGGDIFTLTMTDAATGSNYEIMHCTARAGDVCTVVRGQEGTSPEAWTTGDFANNFLTRDTARAFSQNALAPAGGPTSGRPAVPLLYQPYFDTTLGLPITCAQVSPPIWVTASGVTV